MVYLGNEQGSKAFRLFDPTTQRICVSRDVKFKENETWDWKEYISEHINDEPEWTDIKIGNLEVTNEHHDQGIQLIKEDNEFPNNDDDDYTSPTTEDEPKNYKEASRDQKWIEVMKVELDSINRKNTWELTTLPKGHKAIGLKWQSAYANKILKEAGMLGCNETLIPMDLGTRLTKSFHARTKRATHEGYKTSTTLYKRNKDYGITYMHNKGNKIHGFSDSSYGVNTQEGKGTPGIIFYYGKSPISWSTQKQATVALSSCESEFIVAIAAATQELWLKRLLSKLTHSQEEKVTIKVDNKSAIALMKNLVLHGRSKHIDTKYHFIRECVEREDIQVKFVSGEYQRADILIKALPKIKFLTMRQLIGLKDLRHCDCD
nr:ribonuclease H-like domain, reverse transcriptase, RNA-dependent DNA polymerase [Tanacetum cinerariifolium]